jgi:hypothetical protein
MYSRLNLTIVVHQFASLFVLLQRLRQITFCIAHLGQMTDELAMNVGTCVRQTRVLFKERKCFAQSLLGNLIFPEIGLEGACVTQDPDFDQLIACFSGK